MVFAKMGEELPEWFLLGRSNAHTQVRLHSMLADSLFASKTLLLVECLLLVRPIASKTSCLLIAYKIGTLHWSTQYSTVTFCWSLWYLGKLDVTIIYSILSLSSD